MNPQISESGTIRLKTRLVAQIKARQCILVVGPDVSVEAGLPSHEALAQDLAQEFGYPWKGEPLARVAQFYVQSPGFSRSDLTDWLRSRLRTVGKASETYDLIVSFPWRTIYTTNWDLLIEEAFERAGQSIKLVLRSTNIPGSGVDEPLLVKLYGCVSQPRSQETPLVVTEEDVQRLADNREALLDRLLSDLQRHTVLFMGCDLDQPPFDELSQRVSETLGAYQAYAYATTIAELNPFEVQDWQVRRRVVPFLSSARDFLADLERLLTQEEPRIEQALSAEEQLRRIVAGTGLEWLNPELFTCAVRERVSFFYQGGIVSNPRIGPLQFSGSP